ncbi:TPA: dihydrodipicolinate synthase family protein, partial [Clostridioides difficile]|nr:dihydrodipicolinate synthase family protein [Clostridioides difficile]
ITNPFIPAMKKAMNIRGLQISDYMTAPFVKPNEKQVCEIKKLMNELNIC